MRTLIAGLAPLRALTPAGWLVAIVIAVTGLALVLGGLGFRWDPFDLSRRRLERAERATAEARAGSAARAAEAAGQAGQIVRLDAAHDTLRSLDRVTDTALQTARTADDASQSLPADRADRLRRHDAELCRLAPDLGGCTAPPDPAGAGGPAL
jgi:hypothetical protein